MTTVHPPVVLSTTTLRTRRGSRVQRYISNLFVSFVVVVAVVAASSSAHAQTPVRVGVDGVELEAGAIDTVPIIIDGAEDIVAMHVEITYDPAVLQWDGLENGDLLSSNSLVEVNPDAIGTVIIGIVTLEPISGRGPLLVSRFSVLGSEGATTTVGLQSVAAWDENGFDVLIETQDASLAVTGGGGLPILLIVLVVAAVLAVGIALWLLQRRRARSRSATQVPSVVPVDGTPLPSPVANAVYVNHPVTLVNGQQNPVGQLQPGKYYAIVEENAGWYLLTDDAGNTGWVSAAMVNR